MIILSTALLNVYLLYDTRQGKAGINATRPKISHEDARGIDLRVGVVWGQRVAFTGGQVSCTDLQGLLNDY